MARPSSSDSTAVVIRTRGLLPAVVRRAGQQASKRFVEFFAAQIRNRNTREAYLRAVTQFFAWCEAQQLQEPGQIEPLHVAAYVELLMQRGLAKPTIKQHLAAIRMLFDWWVTGQVVPLNPAASVRGPKHVVKRGKTPVLNAHETKLLLGAIETNSFMGLRDRAFIALMLYSFARVSAVCGMKMTDYYAQGKRYWMRLAEKGGRDHALPVHHKAEEYLDAYLDQTGLRHDPPGSPLWRSATRDGRLTSRGMTRIDAFRMVRRRAAAVGMGTSRICCHSFRATGITIFLQNGGQIETAAQIAAHESPRTTKLYDRRNDAVQLEEIERIRL